MTECGKRDEEMESVEVTAISHLELVKGYKTQSCSKSEQAASAH